MKPIENKNYLSITQETSIRAKLVCIVLLLIVGLLSTAFGMESQHEAEESGNPPMPLIKNPQQGELPINLGDLWDQRDIQSLTLEQIVKTLEQGIVKRGLSLSREELITVIDAQLQKADISCTKDDVARLVTAKTTVVPQKTIEVVGVSKGTRFTVTVKKEQEGEWAQNNGTSIFKTQER